MRDEEEEHSTPFLPKPDTLTPSKRTAIAEMLLQAIFALRDDNSPASQAWILSIMTTGMSRAVLASTGPQEDAMPLLTLTYQQLVAGVQAIQSQFFRNRLSLKPGEK